MTYWRNESGRSAWVEITAPEGEKIHGLYILWAETLVHSVIEHAEGDGWTVIYESADPLFYEQYIPLEGEEHIRIRNPEKAAFPMPSATRSVSRRSSSPTRRTTRSSPPRF